MKEISELHLPDNLKYAKDHEWARFEGDRVIIGISEYAEDQLGDITFVELPEVGDAFEKGEEFGTLESTKAVSELYMPLAGEVLAVNEALNENPGLVNEKPYADGWIIEIKPDNTEELEALMSRDAYLEYLEGLE